MKNISEFGNRILSILEEFKHDNACALLNTTLELNGDADEVKRFASSVAELVELNLIEIRVRAHEDASETPASNDFIRALTSDFNEWISYDTKSSYWFLRPDAIERNGIPIIHATRTGLLVAYDALRSRGYMWWKHKK